MFPDVYNIIGKFWQFYLTVSFSNLLNGFWRWCNMYVIKTSLVVDEILKFCSDLEFMLKVIIFISETLNKFFNRFEGNFIFWHGWQTQKNQKILNYSGTFHQVATATLPLQEFKCLFYKSQTSHKTCKILLKILLDWNNKQNSVKRDEIVKERIEYL